MFVLLFVDAGGLLSQCWLFQTAEWFLVAVHLSLWLLYLSPFPVGMGARWGRSLFCCLGTLPSTWRQQVPGTLAFLSVTSLIALPGAGTGRYFCCLLLGTLWWGAGEVLLSLLARPVAPTVLLRVIPGPLPALSTSPSSEPLLNLFLFCEENLLCVVNCGFPISIQSRLSQGFLVMGVHLEGPFWFPSITVDLFWSAMLCVTSRNLEREWGQVCVMRSLCWSNLWGVLWKQVQSPPTPSSKIQRGLPRELGWQNQLN